jgi:hypothetical protein
MSYCSYYQALVDKTFCWYVVAILKSYDHLAFDRTLDTPTNLFEFYVPESREAEFLTLMDYFKSQHLVSDLKKLPNRLMDPEQEL